jgi:cytochrome P450
MNQISPLGATPKLAHRVPTPGPLATLGILRRTVRNPLESWPPAVYDQGLVRTVFIGRTTWFVSDPDLVQKVLVDDADKLEKAEPMRRALEPALGQGILTAEGQRWKLQRRTASPVFRAVNVNSFLPAMIQAARRTADRWAALPQGAQIDAGSEMMHLTFEIIMETMLSGSGNVDAAVVERSIGDFLESTSWAIALSALRAPLWMPFPGKQRAERGQQFLRTTTAARVIERRASGERRDDLLSLMLDAKDPETGEGLSDLDIVDNILTFIGAGHETTALALTWTFFLLSRHPDIEARVLEEIATITGGARLEAEQVASLTYTKQVIQEAMRVYPPVAMVVRQAVEPFMLGGEPIARGDNVFVPIYAIHHHTALWDEPARFDPDRFAPDAVRARHRYSYLPFGAGPRICIGMGFALLEAVALLATLLPVAHLHAEADFRPTPKLRITMRPAEGMPMSVRRRAA